MTEQSAIRTAFNRAATTYDEAAVLQRNIGDDMLSRLDFIKMQPERILDLGCGTGYFSRALQKRYKNAEIIGLDMAEQMLNVGQQKNTWRNKQRFVCADAYHLPFADNSFDCIFSNLMLQWCFDLPAALKEIARVLQPEGLLMFSTFGPDTLKELRASWQTVDKHPHTNEFTDMHDIGDMLMGERFFDPVIDMYPLTLTYLDVPAMLRELKNMGAQTVINRSQTKLTGKTHFAQLCAAYETYKTKDNTYPATFEVICAHAWGANASQQLNADGNVHVALSTIPGLSKKYD